MGEGQTTDDVPAWTQTPPTVPGWYALEEWHPNPGGGDPKYIRVRCVEVKADGGYRYLAERGVTPLADVHPRSWWHGPLVIPPRGGG